jgi:2-succinyl-5-enolpyruvyl-6-hydroxy-3-cyclohexene-1-carboxylate synthase
VISLLKAHGVRKIVASPGMTNICLVASIQTDPFFEIYSAPDERSAAYIACGMASESGEIVALSCTGATASRNYYPGLTEAYYNKLPILVITSSRRSDRIGHNFDQVTDRTSPTNDIVKLSVQVPFVRDEEDEWACVVAVNRAILEITRRGFGPVHMNLETMYSPAMCQKPLPNARVINRFFVGDELPSIEAKRVAIIVGAHIKWSDGLTRCVDIFCEKYNGAVLCDHTSNYTGKYKVFPNIMSIQKKNDFDYRNADLIISIGNISSSEYAMQAKESWRVNPDGEIRDTFWNLTKVFEMSETYFFKYFASIKEYSDEMEYYSTCVQEEYSLINRLPELPFSNVWIARQTIDRIPCESIVHLGIRNSLRSWNYFNVEKNILFYANTGGFGIDGSLSTALGISLATEKLCFCVLGDLAFFYDMNSLGNRHINSKLRILLINNGTGMEMHFPDFFADGVVADKDSFIAASGHYGNKSKTLVRDYACNLGFEYLEASSKSEYLEKLDDFCSREEKNYPIIFEVFVEKMDEDEAYNIVSSINGKAHNSNDYSLKPSERLANQKHATIVVFGTGSFFRDNINSVREKTSIKYACDNNSEKWGTEVAPGIICISPEELSKISNPFVIIALANTSDSLIVTNQLLDMGIKKFDHLSNWIRYEEKC